MLQGQFDLYYLFVEMVAGSVIASFFVVAGLLFIIMAFGRMSPMMVIYILTLYSLCFFTGYIGALFQIPVFIFAFSYFAISVYRYFVSGATQIGT